MKKYMISLSLVIVFSTCLLADFLTNVSMKAMDKRGIDKHYTSIQIKNGDSLWSIADKYGENSGLHLGFCVPLFIYMYALNDTVPSMAIKGRIPT